MTTQSVTQNHVKEFTLRLLDYGVPFVANPDSQGNWEFTVNREDDDVFARIAI